MRNPSGFRYGFDPVCVTAAVLYVANRFWWKPACTDPTAFVHCYMGDVLCLPVCVPLVLWLQRRLGLRDHDGAPTLRELFAHWLLWTGCFEWLGPKLPVLAPGAVADPLDAVAYAGGGAVAALLWRSELWRPHGEGRVGRIVLALTFACAVLGCYRAAAAMRDAVDMREAPKDALCHEGAATSVPVRMDRLRRIARTARRKACAAGEPRRDHAAVRR